MRHTTRQLPVYASIVALAFLELPSMQQGDALRHPAPELIAASKVSVGPLLSRPRVMPPSAPAVSARVVDLPSVSSVSHTGGLTAAGGDVVSLQQEHVRLQI